MIEILVAVVLPGITLPVFYWAVSNSLLSCLNIIDFQNK